VVGSHGRTALGGILLGSVSRDILVALPCPVAVVPGTSEPLTAQSDALVGEIR
jgi:nucleotide-binding universal stress UspA family protein